ncbi:hypothetical protein [Campylobacter sp. CCUG 57310]|uniref:hypothetical protein n=1 Tax=Campylobacter sp. CCUG 57310 TaxID=2517362 RepID=UPI001566F92D|nr:hypothetical protein [Campylobacter sp. CCUG 57310]QKF93169.1 hypothetical protein CORI_2022 [Campylobacter sp. CCUG 57310]
MRKFGLALLVAMLGVSVNAASCDDAVLSGIVSGLNSKVPQRVDEITTMLRAECVNGGLKYVYEMNDAKDLEVSKFSDTENEVFKNVQSNILKELYCTSLVELHRYTNSIIWSYIDANGKLFAEFEFKPSDCTK